MTRVNLFSLKKIFPNFQELPASVNMVVGRALRATGCASCRLSLLRSFTTVAGPLPRIKHLNAKSSYPSTTPRVRLSSSTTDSDEHTRGLQGARINEEEHEEQIDEEVVEDTVEQDGSSSEVAAVPWYLEVDAPQRAPQPLSERQQIPELPESPPPILQPLLQQISIDLGLDSLTLLDLRKLDPPPALGANLLMVLGTARSEKHLHVSADRLCRWLRSTYKLRPDADGLLGRNELKLKLKRKSKRAKLLGKSSADNDDDGVRTGWVCVDVGVVEGAENSTVAIAEPEGFVGFGRRTDGVRIVVQMMTEEKRELMDLERLWRGILKRGVPAEMEALEEFPSSESFSAATEHTLIDGPRRGIGRGPSTFSHSRGFHTSARHFLEEVRAGEPKASEPESSAAAVEKTELKDAQQFVALSIGSGKYEEAVDYLLQHGDDIPELQNGGWRRFLLEQLRLHLENVSKEQALSDLGQGSYDHDSTPFLLCFYQSLSPSLSKFEGEMAIWLQCYARGLRHTQYGFEGLMQLFEGLQMAGVEISTETYLHLIRSVLRPINIGEKYDGPPRYMVEGAMKILQAMYDQGHNILTEDIFVTLQEATAPLPRADYDPSSIYTSSTDTFELPSLPMNAIQRRIHVLMKSIDIPTFRTEYRIRLLDLYSRNNHWVEFWDVWRLALRQGQPQTAPLYAFMFSRVAETKHQKACIAVLRTWLLDVEREIPAVPLKGEVAEAVKACLLVADPFVERDASDAQARGEWISMWRRCSGPVS